MILWFPHITNLIFVLSASSCNRANYLILLPSSKHKMCKKVLTLFRNCKNCKRKLRANPSLCAAHKIKFKILNFRVKWTKIVYLYLLFISNNLDLLLLRGQLLFSNPISFCTRQLIFFKKYFRNTGRIKRCFKANRFFLWPSQEAGIKVLYVMKVLFPCVLS